MIDKETCEIIIEKYYTDVYKFCYNRLRNIQAAEECTQDVFLLLFQKRARLEFSEYLRSWLYESAVRICNKYISKNNMITEDIDKYADEICDTTPENSLRKEIYEILDHDDADLLLEYIEADYRQRKKIAKRMNITLKTLYRRVDRIREKVIVYLSK